MKIVLLVFFAVACMSLWAGDHVSYFRDEDALAYSNGVASIRDVQCGELYAMTWAGDCHLKRVLDENCTNMMQTIGCVCSKVLNDAPCPVVVTGMGCSAFVATNAVGNQLVGRNFDYRFSMAHVLLFVPSAPECDRPYASIGTVDAGFAGFDVGSLTNLTDMTKPDYPWHAALFPYLCMDGMNESGFMVTVLSLDGRQDAAGQKTRVIEQFVPGHTNVVPTTAIRYLLDHAGTTEEGVAILTNFNMFADSGPNAVVQANYHFLLSDVTGDTRVVEWLPPVEDGGSWTPFVTNATAVSNFWLADGYGHGSNRWEILRHALARQQGHLEEHDAMHLARAVSQKKGAEQTSWTHWSIVYNLADLTAGIATLGNYAEIFPYWFKGDGSFGIGPSESAKPAVETNLQAFAGSQYAVSDKVYLLTVCDYETTSQDPWRPSETGACVSAVNRMGLTYDAAHEPVHVVVKTSGTGANKALFYADMTGAGKSFCLENAVAGLNEKGLSARLVRLATPGTPGNVSASKAMCSALLDCAGGSASEAVDHLKSRLPAEPGTGVVFTDAKGNVALWPEGSEPVTDEASEMVRNSLDLRKGIYEIDGEGRGQFDELPGLLRLASTADTKAIVSIGYGHLDVMLPESNVVWRTQLAGANIPVYGVIADPPSVADATATVTDTSGNVIVRNNQRRLVAETNATLKVVYAAEGDCYFPDGTQRWMREFPVGATVTTPPAPSAAPKSGYEPKALLGVVGQRYPWNGTLDIRYKTPFANANNTVSFFANDILLGTAPGTAGLEATASFDLKGTALDGQQLKSAKIRAEIRP